MVLFSDEEIEKVVLEDVPYFDLTSTLLGISDQRGEISYTARHDMVVCGTEEVDRIFKRFNIETKKIVSSGTFVVKGTTFMIGSGRADELHSVWKATGILLEYASGMATRTYNLVKLAKEGNPEVCVVTTRKHFPGGKKLSIKAILSGGALPHRLGLSETILVFEEHLNFCGGYDWFFENLERLKKKVYEKKIVLEVKDKDLARMAIERGVDILQLDKFSVEDVKDVVEMARGTSTKVAVAGGINETNIKEYASTGVDIIVLSCAYFGKPADIKVSLKAV